MAVAGYRYNELPADERAALPGEDALVDALEAAIDQLETNQSGS